VEVLSSRVLLTPSDFERSLRFYEGTLGLHRAREFGAGGRVTGVVFFIGGGALEVSGSGGGPAPASLSLWLQVRDVDAEYRSLVAAGVEVLEAPADRPWGLREMWVADPDGVRIAVVQVPDEHPLRRRID
jgi:predicted enzyme related to lactoylglutathione lyase